MLNVGEFTTFQVQPQGKGPCLGLCSAGNHCREPVEWAEQWTAGCRQQAVQHHSISCHVLPLHLLPSILAVNCLQIPEAEFPAVIDSFLTKAIRSSVS